jgi:2-haloacid dehalogenase
MKLSDFQVLSFDCYGTLIDWERGLGQALQPLSRASGMGREQLVELYGSLEHELEAEHPGMPYSELLALVYERMAQRLGVQVAPNDAASFGRSVGEWPAFPDSPDALRYLKQHFKLVILSNVDRASFAGSNERLGVAFDNIFTAEEIGSYKPDLRNFEYLLNRLGKDGIEKRQLLHVAQSLFHDHAPANQLGIASAWIDRRHDQAGSGATPELEKPPHYDFSFTSLEGLAEAHRRELLQG